MNFHEHQSKALFRQYGISVPDGKAVYSADEAVTAAKTLAGERWVVKAQAHTGGRGKAGGVKLVDSMDDVHSTALSMLNRHLVTHQTGPAGLPVHCLLVEKVSDIAREIYLSALIDRDSRRLVFMASSEGGMDIEEVAASTPEKILKIQVDPIAGFQAYQGRQLAFSLGLKAKQVGELVKIMTGLYRLFTECDASLIEINPLIVTASGHLMALDAKISMDDTAVYRQKTLAEWRDTSQEDEKELAASQHDLNYITLDGDIGCMVNGAGLAMATMDLIKLHGGSPANFLDVGGGTTAERVAEAFKLIVADGTVKTIFVNIFGGIVRCDLIAAGIISAVKEVGLSIPVVVRLEGTNVEQGRELLADSGLDIISAADLTDGAIKAVAAAGGQS